MPVAELKTTYLGLELKNPLIAGASLLTSGMESLERMERAGAGAVVAELVGAQPRAEHQLQRLGELQPRRRVERLLFLQPGQRA